MLNSNIDGCKSSGWMKLSGVNLSHVLTYFHKTKHFRLYEATVKILGRFLQGLGGC